MKILFRATLATMVCSILVAPRIAAQGAAPGAHASSNAAPALPIPALPPSTNAAPAVPTISEPATNKPAAKSVAKKKPAAKPVTKGPTAPKAKSSPKPAETISEPITAPEPGVSRQDNVNVRGKATLNSEVVTRLKKGDQVTILDEVTLKHASQDEPSHWYKIALPANVAAWVHSSFVDTNNNTVKVRKLNLRGGPGENYSVVGQLLKGDAIKTIDTKGVWLKIEPSTNAFAFVAAHLIEPKPQMIATAPVPKPRSPEVAVVTPPVPAPIPAPVAPPPTVAEVNPVPAPVPAAPVTTPTPTVFTPAPAPAPAESIPAPAPAPAVSATTPAPAPTPETNAPIETVRKIVNREGILKGSVSIQAPAYYELRSLDTHKAIDYVFSPSTNLVLKEFKGLRVIVTGEEVLDERWQHTPVLIVDSVQPVP